MEGHHRELAELLHKYDTALFTTRGPDGHFHTRPMAVQRRGFGEEIWFATSSHSQKIEDIRNDEHCAVSFYKGDHGSTYVSMSGRADVETDRVKIHEMWDPTWKAWFPEGPDSEDLVLVRFRPEHAEWVHPKTGKPQVWAAMARRLLTHQRVEPAEKKEIDLNA